MTFETCPICGQHHPQGMTVHRTLEGEWCAPADFQPCPRCKKPTNALVDYVCLDCRAELVGPGDDREATAITVDFPTTHERVEAMPVRQQRNERCACGSGRKYKKCCYLANHERSRLQRLADDAERRRRWEEERAKENVTGRRRSPSTATLIAMAAMGMVQK